MNNLINFFSHEFVAALGWSLLHSLWQGALIALLLGIALLFLQKRSSNVRYTLAASSLGLTLVAFFGTFAYLFNAAKAQQEAFNDTLYIVTQENYNHFVNQVTAEQSLLSIFLEYFNQHLPVIVVFWFLGVLVLSLRFLGGLAYLQRLRHTQNQPISEHWQERLNSIKTQIGLSKSVQLLESALIRVPMVIGYLKPIVLLPIGTINALSAAEVEAILAHELAHIKRNDYLINLIQSIIDVLFFYHPAVWWMSNTVRTERENCCDDLALSVTGNSLIIAKALANLESLRQRSYHLSLAFTGNKNQLFNRISRLLGQPMKKNNHFVEGLVAVIVIILCLTTINYRVNASVTETKDELTEMVSDSIIPKEEIIIGEGEEVIEEYIIIEEEVEVPVAPDAPFPVRWVENPDGVLALAKVPNAPKAFFSNEFALADGTTTTWANGSNGKIILKQFPNGSTRFVIPSADELEVIAPADLIAPGHILDMPEVPTWKEQEHSIHIMPSGTNEFLFDNAPHIDGNLFDENFKYEWKLDNKKNLKFKVHSLNAVADTSILEDAEVIIIDGDKITVVRRKSKLSDDEVEIEINRMMNEVKRLERLKEMEKVRVEREVEQVKAMAHREKEMAERRLEMEKERLKHQQHMLEERTKAEQERIKAETKRMELRTKERIKEQEMRLKEQKERVIEMQIRAEERAREAETRAKERAEKQSKQNERIENELRKDGILKSGEKLKTINVNKNNDEVTIKVNGKNIPEDKVEKYMRIIKD